MNVIHVANSKIRWTFARVCITEGGIVKIVSKMVNAEQTLGMIQNGND